ncbi:MAG: hypothetical protein FJZ01_11565, partial [Candidatus Sericytochromatia bacterium]|nr:hypothetical protein [Candidatus Tanganyikabacteria bacterium]
AEQQPAAAVPAATGYASQVAASLDAYLEKVVVALQGASREGPGGFDKRTPQLAGPAGRPLGIVYVERLTDSLSHHPRALDFLTRDDITGALRGQNVVLRGGQLIVTVANPGGASAIGVAIPAAEIAPRLPEAAAAGGVLLFGPGGEPFAVNGTLTADQLAVFSSYLPQKPPNLVVTETPFSVALCSRADLVVVTRMAPSAAAPEPQLTAPLFVDPAISLKEQAAGPGMDMQGRLAIALPVALGVLGVVLILLGRRRRRAEGRDTGQAPAMSGMDQVDYLDALATDKAGGRDLELDIDGEDAILTEVAAAEPFVEGVGEVRTLASADPPGASVVGPPAPAAGLPGSAAEVLPAEDMLPAPTEPEGPGEPQREIPATAGGEAVADVAAPEGPDEEAGVAEPTVVQPHAAEAASEPEEVDQLLADLIETTAQEARDDAAEEAAREAAADAAAAAVAAERAQLRDRASRLKERLSERFDGPKPPAGRPAEKEPPTLPGKPREIVHIGRTGNEEGLDTLRRHKTVNPGDVLITKGEAQTLVEKEHERLFGRMQALTREVEIRTAEALAIHRETFKELLEQFEALQENRDADLAAMNDLKNDLANEVTAATLKLKQAEAKATDGMLRLKDQMDNLTRKLEGWAADARISEERLAGALETIREGWENQLEAHAELRKEVQRLTELHQDISRKQEANADREAAERRSAIEQLAFEIKTVQLQAENDFSVMASRLDELKSAIGTLGGRLDRTEGSQAQALDAVYRKIEAGEAVEALKSRVARDLEDLKVRLDRGETNSAEVRGMLEAMQSDLREESSRILSQVIHEVEKGIATSTQSSVAYQNQIDALKEENARLSQRQHQIVQLMASLHTAIGKADARASEEVERLKAQNNELQQMMLSMMRGGPRPQTASPQPPASPPQRRPAPTGADGRPIPPAAPGQVQPGPSAPPTRHAPPPPADAPQRPAPVAADEDDDAADAKPIDLWSRLLGRGDENTSARKRRTK